MLRFGRFSAGIGASPPGESATGLLAAIEALAPASLWRFDALVGGNYDDLGSAGIDGTPVAGARSQARLDGMGVTVEPAAGAAVMQAGDVYRFINRAAFTVLTIHKPTSLPAGQNRALVAKQNGAGTIGWDLAYGIAAPNGSPYIERRGGNFVEADYAPDVNDWNLIAGTYDGNNLAVYLNGHYKGAVADANNLGGSADVLRVNGDPADGRAAPGRYALTAVWTRALTQAELDGIWAEF